MNTRAKKYALPLVVVMAVLLAVLVACSATASAHACDCPNGDKFHGTLNGGIYFERSPMACDAQTMSWTFYDVPDKDKVKFARVYTGIWGGSPSKGGVFDITVNGNPSPTYTACDPCPQATDCHTWQEERCDALNWTTNSNPPSITTECHEYITGCLVNFIAYNATPYIATGGTNTVTVKSGCSGKCTCWDGRIYSIGLLVVYEDASMPEITYWINEGTRYLDNGSACCWSDVNFPEVFMYFNGSAYPGSASDLKYWTSADPNGARVNPEFNVKPIGAPDYKSGTNFQRWDNIPVSYLNPLSNLFYYYNPVASYERIDVAVLMLNSSGRANLTVTDISPCGLYADPDETRRYANVINATVVNYGKTAHFFDVTLYVNDTKVDVKRVTNLSEGESRVVSLLWAPNQTGLYTLNVTADVENIVRETDETNNSKTLPVTVTEAPPPEWQSQSSNDSDNKIPNGGSIELRAQGKAGTGLYNAILATDETGTWMNCTGYGSPMNMASYYNYSFAHTSDADWNNQTIEKEPVYYGKPLLVISGGDVKLAQVTVGTENLAWDEPPGSKPASASSSTYPPRNANDGDPGTVWWSGYGAGYFPCWWKVDLGEVTDIVKIDIVRDEVRWKYSVLTSTDGTDWEERIYRYYGNPETFTNLDWSCRYINITIYEDFSGWDVAMMTEFEAYGPGDYASNGTLTSSTIETSSPVVSVIPTWNSTEPDGTNILVNVSVDNGVTWKNATNGTELTWDYGVYNTSLKYKVLFETTNLSRTPVMHDVTLNYTTKNVIKGEWLWSNFSWHNSSVTDKTVGWKIYYEDMLGKTNCTDVKTFKVGEEGVPNVVVTVHNTSFGNMLAGDNNTIYVSLTLNNSEGTAPATIEAVFKTNVSEIYGLNGTGSNIIPGNYFELGPDGSETALTNSTTKRFISTLDAGAIVDYNAILIVPAGQAADDYSGIVELSW
jgi:hypothetical protein